MVEIDLWSGTQATGCMLLSLENSNIWVGLNSETQGSVAAFGQKRISGLLLAVFLMQETRAGKKIIS